MQRSLKEKTAGIRRDHLLAAALRVFAERGYRRSTIRDIAREAGVADGTIYNVFANKAELIVALIDPLAAMVGPAEDILHDRWRTLTPEVIDMLRVVLSEAIVDAELRPLVYERIVAPVVGPLERVLAACDAGGAGDPAIASRAVVASVLGLAVLRMLGDATLMERWAEVPAQLADLFSPLLTRAKGA